jgi:hypothetical protein
MISIVQKYDDFVMDMTCFRILGADRLVSISFLYQGCPTVTFQAAAYANRTWRLEKPLVADGFILTLSDTAVGGAPVRFSLQSSADAGASWATIGTPDFRWTANGALFAL